MKFVKFFLVIIYWSHVTLANCQVALDKVEKIKTDEEVKKLVGEQRKNTHLTIKHGGHISSIRKMAVTNDGKTIITAGDDKVIYIRNAQTGDVIDALYGEVGDGSHGQIYAMALSPDNKYLVVAGFFADAHDYSGRVGAIRLYDFPNRKLLCLLQEGESEVVNALAFTDDSKLLISGSGSIMKVWDVEKRVVKSKFAEERTLPIYSVDISNDKVVNASNAGTVRLWSLASTKSLKVDSTHTAGVNCVAFSPNGLTIASGGYDKKLVIYDNELNVKQIIENGTSPTCIAFSPDGKRILLGAEGDSVVSNLYFFDGKSWNKEVSFAGLSNSATMATAFINNKTALCAGGNSYEIVKWTWQTDPKTQKVSAKELNRFTGKGKPIFNIGFKDNQLFYANDYEEDTLKNVMTKSFDLITKKITDITSPPADYAKSIHKIGGWSLALEQSNEKELITGIQQEQRVLKVIKEGSSSANRIKKDAYEGFGHFSYTFATNSILNRPYIVSGGSGGKIIAYDINGIIQTRLVGHRDLVTDIIVSPDGKYLFSCSRDQTIKIWSTLDLGKKSNIVPAPADVVDPQFLTYFEQRNLVNTSKKATFEAWDVIINDLRTLGYLEEVEYMKKSKQFFSAGVVKPLASIFIGTDGEWIIWSEDGYFTCSKYGGKYIGYHVNKGFDKEARFYPFEQFDLKYNRPDIMLERLGINDESLKAAYYKAYKKRLSKMDLTEDDLSEYINLPEVTLLSRSQETTNKEIEVEFDAKDDFFKINRINIFVNDVPVFGSKGMSVKKLNQQAVHQKHTVKLKKGKNKIQVSAMNEKGIESLRETYQVIRNDAIPQVKDRYVVAIGISDYADDNFDLKYASKDAKDLANLLQSNKADYASTKVLLILDKQATRENVLKAKEFFMQSKFDDQAILFVAGHGLLDENLDWYFATTDVDFSNPSTKGIIYSDLEEILDSIPASNKLMFMDACHSGEVDKEESQLVADNEKQVDGVKSRGFMKVASKTNSLGLQSSFQLMQSIFTDVSKSTGTNVISSASGAEYAYESATWNNGVFTYALLEGLKTGKADTNKDKAITVSEIRNYVFSRVAQLTNGKQTPTSRKENLEFDFRVW